MVQQRGGAALQDPFLNILRRERVPVSVFLVNGIKLQGQIESFDQFAVLLRNSVSQMIYKHAISTIVPARTIRIPHDGRSDDYGNDPQRGGNDPQRGNDPQHGNEPHHPEDHPSY